MTVVTLRNIITEKEDTQIVTTIKLFQENAPLSNIIPVRL